MGLDHITKPTKGAPRAVLSDCHNPSCF